MFGIREEDIGSLVLHAIGATLYFKNEDRRFVADLSSYSENAKDEIKKRVPDLQNALGKHATITLTGNEFKLEVIGDFADVLDVIEEAETQTIRLRPVKKEDIAFFEQLSFEQLPLPYANKWHFQEPPGEKPYFEIAVPPGRICSLVERSFDRDVEMLAYELLEASAGLANFECIKSGKRHRKDLDYIRVYQMNADDGRWKIEKDAAISRLRRKIGDFGEIINFGLDALEPPERVIPPEDRDWRDKIESALKLGNDNFPPPPRGK